MDMGTQLIDVHDPAKVGGLGTGVDQIIHSGLADQS